MKRGKFITFEGDDGCGKTTHIKLLEEYLRSKSLDVLVTKEPGDSPIGKAIRNILLNPEYKEQLTPLAELLLFEADRSIHTEKRIKPGLHQGKIVLCDRYYDSTTAYQGATGKISLGLIFLLNEITSNMLKPDLTFYLDANPEEILSKIKTTEFGALDRLESRPIEEHQRRRELFMAMTLLEPERVKLIKYLPNKIEEMQKQIRFYVDKIL